MNNSTIVDKINDPNTSDEDKQIYQNQILQAVNEKLGLQIAQDVKVVSTDETGQGGKQVKGFITTENDTIYSNEKNQNTSEDTMLALADEIAGSWLKSKKIDITTDRDQHQNYENIVDKNTLDDISFLSNNYDLGINLNTVNNHVVNTNQVTSTPSVFNTQTINNNMEFAGLDKEAGDNRQLAPEEVSLNYTRDAEGLKKAIADNYPNFSKQSIDSIFKYTQKDMVNNMDNYMMNLQINTTYKNQKNDIQFIAEEARLYFAEASKGKVYTDRNTLTNRSMMDANNYNDSTYNPSSNKKIVKDTVVSVGLTVAGLVPNPVIAIPAWTADTVRNSSNNDFSDGVGTVKNVVAPSLLGNPLASPISQKLGAGVSIINTGLNVIYYTEEVNQLDLIRDTTNGLELQITNQKYKKPFVYKPVDFIKVYSND